MLGKPGPEFVMFYYDQSRKLSGIESSKNAASP